MLAQGTYHTKLCFYLRIISPNQNFPFEVKWPKLLSMLGRCRRRLTLTAVHFFGNCLLAGAYIAEEDIPLVIGEDIEKVQ